jgi:hypothetical protein
MSVDDKKEGLLKEKKALKKVIYTWTKGFIAKNQRDPTKEEKELLARDMFKKYKMVNSFCMSHFVVVTDAIYYTSQ